MSSHKVWRKSRRSSAQSTCVELAVEPLRTSIRDSKARGAGELGLGAAEFTALLTGVKRGMFDRPV
ncbi:MAG: DUF397 domain-containing protein [Actinomycetota bacterium]|nr:DUF397 domain-containing protein [Actinomycetota bacterium]